MKTKVLFVIVVLAFLVLLSHLTKGCGGNARKETRLAWPLEYMLEKDGVGVFYGETDKGIFISAAKDVQLSKLVDLELFGAFQPGLKIEEANRQFGDPLRTYTKRNSEIRAIYEMSNGLIEVADHPFSSGGEETSHRRSIYIYLKPKIEGCAQHLMFLILQSRSSFRTKPESRFV